MEEPAPPFDFEAVFRAHYGRIARAIARVIRDPARAEELAVEVLWRFWRTPRAREQAAAWLYRTAVRAALNELRGRTRGQRREQLADLERDSPDPEKERAAAEAREHVRRVLAAMNPVQAEVLLLQAGGLSYAELAAALEMHPASVGTTISRARQAFRKEFIQRYGEQ